MEVVDDASVSECLYEVVETDEGFCGFKPLIPPLYLGSHPPIELESIGQSTVVYDPRRRLTPNFERSDAILYRGNFRTDLFVENM